MITDILSQGAATSNQDPLEAMVDSSSKSNKKTEVMLTDAGYDSGANVCYYR